jgi:hypothetical protein
LKLGFVISPALLFSLRIALAFQHLLCYQMSFTIDFSIAVKNDIGILMGIILTL